MENNSSKNPVSSLVSALQKRIINNPETDPADKVILQDECGDSLWDEVLAQEEKLPSLIKNQAQPGNAAKADEGKD